MIDIEKLRKEQEIAYRKRFDRWYKKERIEERIKTASLEGFTAFAIEVTKEKNEKIKRMESNYLFCKLLREKLPDFKITLENYKLSNLFYTNKPIRRVVIDWSDADKYTENKVWVWNEYFYMI